MIEELAHCLAAIDAKRYDLAVCVRKTIFIVVVWASHQRKDVGRERRSFREGVVLALRRVRDGLGALVRDDLLVR